MINQVQSFLQKITDGFNQQQLIKITLGNKREKMADLKNVFVKPVTLKEGIKLCFTYRNNTQDVFKNYGLTESISLLKKMLETDFYNADLFTNEGDYFLTADKNGKVKIVSRPASLSLTAQSLEHNKIKKRLLNTHQAGYLHELGVTTADGVVKKDMQDKYKQINHYVEIISGIIKDIDFGKTCTVADMGSGKGYLTFALYDYLNNIKQVPATILGVEVRADLVKMCNAIAVKINYNKLQFIKGNIEDADLPAIDMLIALHACDTATDDAIYKGIQADAKVIVCAPCCHKQIRKQMMPDNALKNITRHGILLERQAEMVTDTIRALLLEAHGYKTKVFDFISTEHTPKNVMIAAVKSKEVKVEKDEVLKKVTELKKLFNIEYHYLEKLFSNNKTSSAPL